MKKRLFAYLRSKFQSADVFDLGLFVLLIAYIQGVLLGFLIVFLD